MKSLSSLLLAALAAFSFGAASAGVTTDLRSALAEHGANGPAAAVVPNAACDVGEPDLIVHDDGSGENGYGWNPVANVGRIADKFTPVDYPATISTVCAAFITNTGATSFNFNLVVYAADGAAGAPGTELGSKALVGHPAGIAGLPFTPSFEAFDISDLAITIASGDVYISMEWDAAVEPAGVFLGSDESAGTPLNGGQMRADIDPWAPIVNANPNYKAMLVRAAFPVAGPGAPSVQKTFAPAQMLAGEVSTLTITLRNTTQPTDAVLAADFSDNLPAGLAVASPANASTTCVGGTLTAADGDDTITLSSGAAIPAGDVCTITVDVTGGSDGLYTNTIPAGALQTNHGNNAGTATANLKIGFTFPEPYCNVTFPSAVEPISRVIFADIDNPSDPTLNGSPALEDFTAIVGHVVPGQTVQIAVEGNTDGFDTEVGVYIDWDGDWSFDPINEYQYIGTLNSSGTDNVQVTANVLVPVSAATGDTRMRVIKKWNAEAPPCNTAGYGQAEDYTLNVAPLTGEPKVEKAFSPAQVLADDPSTLTITLKNLDSPVDATLTADFTDSFPSGLVVANTPNAATTCGGGAVTANAGDGSVTLASGAVIPGGDVCTVTVDVQSSTDGTYLNTIAAGDLVTDGGSNPFPASASLKVGFTFPEPYCPVAFPSTVEPITHVEFADIDNTSDPTVGGSPALEDFTAIIGSVVQGQTVNLKVQGNTAGNYPTPVVAYIDWNQDGVFDPGTEKYSIGTLVNSTGTDSQSVDADIAVPGTALLGTTRMRVIKKYNAEADPCNTAGYGQAEDYTINVSTGGSGPFTVTPSIGTGASEPGNTISPDTPQTVNLGDTATFTLSPASGWEIVNVTGTCGGTLTGNSFETDPVDSNCTVKANFQPIGGFFPAPYCNVTFPSAVEPITRVVIDGIDNHSDDAVGGSPALEDFLAVVGNLSQGGLYPMAVEGNTAGGFTTKIRVFFDWNQDGDFDDAGESYDLSDLIDSTGLDGKQSTGNILVPATAALGATRMRVTKKFNTFADPCNSTGYGQAEDYTILVNDDPLPVPAIEVDAATLSLSAVQEGTDQTLFGIGNVGDPGSLLNFQIREAYAERVNGQRTTANVEWIADNDRRKLGESGLMGVFTQSGLAGRGLTGLPVVLAATDISQMADNSPGNYGVACNATDGTAIRDNSWWRRFYLDEYPAISGWSAMDVQSVTVSSGGVAFPGGLPVTINLYTTPHSVTVDTINTAQLTLIGTADFVAGGDLQSYTVPVTGTVDDMVNKDLVVEYHTDGATGSVWYPGANATPETHPTFISSSACSITTPTPTSGIGFPDFHLTMIVTVDEGGGGGPVTPGCDNPANVPWLSVNPASGTVLAGDSKQISVTGNAAGMAPGTYEALLCIDSDDPLVPRYELPVSFEVTATPVGIFCNSFEDGEGNTCESAPPSSPDIVTGVINQPLVQSLDGSTFDFVTGAWGSYDPGRADDVNLYDFGDGMYVYWFGDVSALPVGGVLDGSGEFAVLHSGDTIGPGSSINAGSIKMTNWVGGVDGYLGIAFENEETGQLNYGYIHLTTSAPDGYPAQVLEYAYDKAGNAIVIP